MIASECHAPVPQQIALLNLHLAQQLPMHLEVTQRDQVRRSSNNVSLFWRNNRAVFNAIEVMRRMLWIVVNGVFGYFCIYYGWIGAALRLPGAQGQVCVNGGSHSIIRICFVHCY